MGLAVVGAGLTVLWVVGGLVAMPRDANEDQRTERDTAILFAGAMLAVETVTFFVGWSLQQARSNGAVEKVVRGSRRRRWLLVPYLVGSIGLGALASYLPRIPVDSVKPLGLLVCQPYILLQIIGGGLLGIKLKGDELQHLVTAAANLLYFSILFYPLYRILTMDRKAEAAAYLRMKIVLGLLLGAHILITLFLVVVSRA